MKKLVLFFATAVVAVSFAACGQKAAQKSESNDTVAAQQEQVAPVANDSLSSDSVAAAGEQVVE
jgi:predicted small lipoprotein YifL